MICKDALFTTIFTGNKQNSFKQKISAIYYLFLWLEFYEGKNHRGWKYVGRFWRKMLLIDVNTFTQQNPWLICYFPWTNWSHGMIIVSQGPQPTCSCSHAHFHKQVRRGTCLDHCVRQGELEKEREEKGKLLVAKIVLSHVLVRNSTFAIVTVFLKNFHVIFSLIISIWLSLSLSMFWC